MLDETIKMVEDIREVIWRGRVSEKEIGSGFDMKRKPRWRKDDSKI